MTTAHILVVDDDAIARDNLADILKREGYRATTAAGGDDALRLLEETDFELMVTDLRMQGMDGAGAVGRVQAHPARTARSSS